MIPGSVVTLVSALERSGKTLIYTTGSGIVADSAAGEYAGSVHFAEDTYFEPVPFRRLRVAMIRFVRAAAIDKGIRSIVICPTMIYGRGHGLQPDSDQLPKLMALSRQLNAGAYFGKGLNRYSNVHIDDLVDLYLLALGEGSRRFFLFRRERRHILQGNRGNDQPFAWARRENGESERGGSRATIWRRRRLRRGLEQPGQLGQCTSAWLVSQSTYSGQVFREPSGAQGPIENA